MSHPFSKFILTLNENGFCPQFKAETAKRQLYGDLIATYACIYGALTLMDVEDVDLTSDIFHELNAAKKSFVDIGIIEALDWDFAVSGTPKQACEYLFSELLSFVLKGYQESQ